MKFDILTLFPEFFASPLSQTIMGRAIKRGLLKVGVHNIRDYATDKHNTVDDSPYGGGAGMVMKVEPLVRALEAVKAGATGTAGAIGVEGAAGAVKETDEEGSGEVSDKTCVILTTPQGEPFNQQTSAELVAFDRLIIICGRYEGMDERVLNFVDREVSVGDYILTGGELPALTIMDSVARHVPGVLGSEQSVVDESFSNGLLEYPQYTRPNNFRGMAVPEVLLSGNHAEIERWRREESIKRTAKRRPDLTKK